MFWLIFTLIYIISFALHITIIYFEYKKYLYTIGDIIDEIEFCVWYPVIYTVTIILLMVGLIFVGLEKLWVRFRNIKIKK